MPEVLLTMQWPDGSRSSLYSPSTVIHEHFKAGERLTVAEVKRRGSVALQQASERVRARYGFACTRTQEEESRLCGKAAEYDDGESVEVIELR